MKIGVYINKDKPRVVDILSILIEEFKKPDHEIIYLNEHSFISDLLNNKLLDINKSIYDILVSIGGDGTIFKVSEFIPVEFAIWKWKAV